MFASLRTTAMPSILRSKPTIIGTSSLMRSVSSVPGPAASVAPIIVARSSSGSGKVQPKRAKNARVAFEADRCAKVSLLSRELDMDPRVALGEKRAYLAQATVERYIALTLVAKMFCPHALVGRDGGPSLTYIANAEYLARHCGLTVQELRTLVKQLERSATVQRLAMEERSGNHTRPYLVYNFPNGLPAMWQ